MRNFFPGFSFAGDVGWCIHGGAAPSSWLLAASRLLHRLVISTMHKARALAVSKDHLVIRYMRDGPRVSPVVSLDD